MGEGRAVLEGGGALACLARLPKTNSKASMTLDFPLPLGPTTEENDCGGQRAVPRGGMQFYQITYRGHSARESKTKIRFTAGAHRNHGAAGARHRDARRN